MTVVTFRCWTVHLCPRCEGTFYREDDLQALLEQPDLRLSYLRPALLRNLDAPFSEEVATGPIPCPTCQQVMKKEPYDGELSLQVDRCSEGHGVWLNDGELGSLWAQRELLYPTADPGFFEGLRRLLGMRPRLSTVAAGPPSETDSEPDYDSDSSD